METDGMKTDTEQSGIAFFHEEPISTAAEGTGEAFEQPYIALRSEPPSWFTECVDTIKGLEQLQVNWDSYGARAVEPRSIENAVVVLCELARIETVERPTVTASPEGHAALCWDYGDRSLDVEFLPDGQIEYVFMNQKDPSKDDEGIIREIQVLANLLTRSNWH